MINRQLKGVLGLGTILACLSFGTCSKQELSESQIEELEFQGNCEAPLHYMKFFVHRETPLVSTASLFSMKDQNSEVKLEIMGLRSEFPVNSSLVLTKNGTAGILQVVSKQLISAEHAEFTLTQRRETLSGVVNPTEHLLTLRENVDLRLKITSCKSDFQIGDILSLESTL